VEAREIDSDREIAPDVMIFTTGTTAGVEGEAP
jgi:hypothetical protein